MQAGCPLWVQKRKWRRLPIMSVLPPTTDICSLSEHVRFLKADIAQYSRDVSNVPTSDIPGNPLPSQARSIPVSREVGRGINVTVQTPMLQLFCMGTCRKMCEAGVMWHSFRRCARHVAKRRSGPGRVG